MGYFEEVEERTDFRYKLIIGWLALGGGLVIAAWAFSGLPLNWPIAILIYAGPPVVLSLLIYFDNHGLRAQLEREKLLKAEREARESP